MTSRFFDNINHDVLISILSERIHDERFCDWYENSWKRVTWNSGNTKTPISALHKAGIISPILANVYLDKLDKFMLRYIETFNKSKAINATPFWIQKGCQSQRQTSKETEEWTVLRQKKGVFVQEIKYPWYREIATTSCNSWTWMKTSLRGMQIRTVMRDDFLILCYWKQGWLPKNAKEDIKNFLQETSWNFNFQTRRHLSQMLMIQQNFLDLKSLSARVQTKRKKDCKRIPIRSLEP